MPVRSVIGGAVVAVAALVAAVTFGTSLTNLVDRPRLFGWAWDVADDFTMDPNQVRGG